ncbi:MAG: bifunctional adenosylcobinamide kinase/adenosylcobinamide-phosphate guanylyltransferase [Pseudomonadota bacterium]
MTLVLGGARSGKSAFAENLAASSRLSPIYIATAQVFEAEMRSRVDQHIKRRGNNWETVEEPDDLEGALLKNAKPGRVVLVDCLTLWITNLMMSDADVADRSDRLVEVCSKIKSPIVLVSNEVGMGIVPDNKMARDFRDHAGHLHQRLATVARQVYLVSAGLPLTLKG